MRGPFPRPSGLGPGILGRHAHPSAATRLPGRSYSRDLSGPAAGLLASLPILTARAAVFHEVQPRSSLQPLQYGRLHPQEMLAKSGMEGEQSLTWPQFFGPSQPFYLRLTGSRHITSSLPLFLTLLSFRSLRRLLWLFCTSESSLVIVKGSRNVGNVGVQGAGCTPCPG